MWAEGPYLHAFANLGRPPFSFADYRSQSHGIKGLLNLEVAKEFPDLPSANSGTALNASIMAD